MDQWYVLVNGQQVGPISLEELRQRIAGGTVNAESMVWTQGMAQWAKAGTVGALFGGAATGIQAPYIGPLPSAPGAVASLVCGIVGVVFGCVGLILGIIAIKQSKKAKALIASCPGTYGGGGVATAGLILGIIATVWGALGMAYMLFVFFVVGAAALSRF